jgi:hypothetical protein
MLSDRVRASRKPGITGYAVQGRLPGSIYPEMLCFATKCAAHFRERLSKSLSRLKLGVALDEFFCATAWKTYGHAAVFFVAFYADYGANAIARMAHLTAKHGICVGATFHRGPAERAYGSSRLGCCHRGFRFAANAPQKLVR